MKATKQIFWIASIALLVVASNTVLAQGTVSSDDPSLVDPSDIFTAPPVSQWPNYDLVLVNYDPSQAQPDNTGIASPSALFSPSPVPEPSALSLLAAGLFVLTVAARRFRLTNNSNKF